MSETIFFESALTYFIDQLGASDTASTQTGIVQQAADVTAHLVGPNQNLFQNWKLTAWRRVISPPSPPGPRPATAQSPGPQRMFLLRSSPSNKPAIRMDSLGHTYVISGVLDKNSKHPLRVDALGYLELSVTTLPFPSPIPKQGSNRFTANLVVNGTTWNQTEVGLILNFVKIFDSLRFEDGSLGASHTFEQGGGQSTSLHWTATAQLFPPVADDYPIEFVFGSGFGDLVAGELSMNPSAILVTWNSPADASIIDGSAEVSAYWFAPLVTDQSFTVMEDFFNGSIGRQSPTLGYSIVGAGP